jgi:hypothetical protein
MACCEDEARMDEDAAAPLWPHGGITLDQHRGGVAIGYVPLANQFE